MKFGKLFGRKKAKPEEAKSVLSAGFEYITEKNGIMLFRNPKRFVSY